MIARLFLVLNGVDLKFEAASTINTIIALAAGDLTEDELADWFRLHIV